MKLWIARKGNGELWAYDHKPIKKDGFFQSDFELDKCVALGIPEWCFNEVTFENSPQEVEISLHHSTTKLLTRDYFANHNWEIVTHKPDENGFVLWEARWVRSIEKGSPYYSDLTVTNMMYEDRFCVSGKTGEGNVEYLMAYTEEDLENILKVLGIYSFYEQESN